MAGESAKVMVHRDGMSISDGFDRRKDEADDARSSFWDK
jgi:hypothetical protein